jgi:uncharacterized protein YndB with AHSA1/START domain
MDIRIEREIYISASADRVWEAIVEPEIVSRYFVVPLVMLEPRPGGKVLYARDGRSLLDGTVLEYEPGKKLVHSWAFPFWPDDPPSRVTYRVEPIGEEMCKLTLIHDGFATRTRTYDEVEDGWTFALENLKLLLETGAALPWPHGTADEGGDHGNPA